MLRPAPRRAALGPLAMLAAAALALAWMTASAAASPPAAGPSPSRPHQNGDSGAATHHDLSRPLRELGHNLGHPPGETEEGREQLPHPPRSPLPDPVVQGDDHAVAASAPVGVRSFEGLGQGFTGPQGKFTVVAVPPDTNSAVSGDQIVEVVNLGLAVFTKSGKVSYGPVDTNSLWSGFGGPCQSSNDGDGVVRYDRAADRWILTQFANTSSQTGPFYECLAVSKTNDATGAYYRYAFRYANFPDYPKLSVWPDAYYLTYNLFDNERVNFLGAEVCALDRARMLTGRAARQQCFTTSTKVGSLLPADVDSAAAPPAGEPNTLVSLGTSNTALEQFAFHVDWADTTKTTFTGPRTVKVANFSPACGDEGTCVPQSGVIRQLDSLSDRLMFRLAYRNFGDHESLVVTHSVTVGSSTGVRWYELRLSAGKLTVAQQSTYAPDATFRWMGSAAMDRRGGIGVGYSVSSASTHPGIRFSGRLAGDPPGRLTQGETTFITGGGSQNGFPRWGDYASMSIDPADDCTFWFSSEYIPANGSRNWHTRIGSFQLPGCAASGR